MLRVLRVVVGPRKGASLGWIEEQLRLLPPRCRVLDPKACLNLLVKRGYLVVVYSYPANGGRIALYDNTPLGRARARYSR